MNQEIVLKPGDPYDFEDPYDPLTILKYIKPTQKSFFIEIGPTYKGLSFRLDPAIVKFSHETDCLNWLVIGRDINLGLLLKVLQKCPKIENLKIFGIRIHARLVKLIADHCPKLVNLELNPYENTKNRHHGKNGLIRCFRDIKRLMTKSKYLQHLIVRKPTLKIVDYVDFELDHYGLDQAEDNYMFLSPLSEYEEGFDHDAHHYFNYAF